MGRTRSPELPRGVIPARRPLHPQFPTPPATFRPHPSSPAPRHCTTAPPRARSIVQAHKRPAQGHTGAHRWQDLESGGVGRGGGPIDGSSPVMAGTDRAGRPGGAGRGGPRRRGERREESEGRPAYPTQPTEQQALTLLGSENEHYVTITKANDAPLRTMPRPWAMARRWPGPE